MIRVSPARHISSSLRWTVTERNRAGILAVGIGNRMRQDDGAGPAVADHLRNALGPLIEEGRVEVCEEWGEGARLIDLMGDRAAVILIDAAGTGSQPGTLHVFDASQGVIPTGMLCYSTHRFGVAEAVEVARNLDLMPPKLMVFAIEAGDLDHGEELTAPVAQTVAEAGRRITQLITALTD